MIEYATDETRDYETINGKIYMMSRPNMDHIAISGNIYEIFRRFLKGKTCKVYFEPDVFFDDENNFIPDIVVLCDKDKKKFKGIYGAPDLVIEILSPSTDVKDMGEKKDIYGQTGVKEYWVVDPHSKKISVYLLSNNSLEISNIYYYRSAEELDEMPDDDKKAVVPSFTANLFNDMEIILADVFQDVE